MDPVTLAAIISAIAGVTSAGIGAGVASKNRKQQRALAGIDKKGNPLPTSNAPGAQRGQETPEGINKYSTLNPQQQELQNSAISQALQILQTGKAPGFAPIAEQARANFASKTVPLLAERFGGQGVGIAGGERGSSALYGQLSGAGSQLERGLKALEAQYGQNILPSLLKASFSPGFDYLVGTGQQQQQQQQQPSFWEQAINGIGRAAPTISQWYDEYQKYQEANKKPASEYDINELFKKYNQFNNTDTSTPYNFSQQPNSLFGTKLNVLGGGR